MKNKNIRNGRWKVIAGMLLYPLLGWTGIPTLLGIEGLEDIEDSIM